MGDARIPKIASGVKGASAQTVSEADFQRLSDLLKSFLRSHLSPKAIDKLARDPRLAPFFRDLFATHRPDEILKIEVISQRGQIAIRATLNKDVTQCGVDSSRDGYSEKRKCTTSNIVSESTLKLDRNYVARLNARPRLSIRAKPKSPPEVASVPEIVKPAPKVAPVEPEKPATPQSIVIHRNPSERYAPGTLMHELTRRLTPREKLSQDIFREGVAVDELRQQEAAQAEARGSMGIVLETRLDTEQLNRQIGRANQSAAQKVANLFLVDPDKVSPGQVGSGLHRIFVNRSAPFSGTHRAVGTRHHCAPQCVSNPLFVSHQLGGRSWAYPP